jgi:general secretion pathway protein F
MATFSYTAIGADGQVHTGELEAAGRDSAVESLFAAGLTPLQLRRDWLKLPRSGRSKLDLAGFTRRLHTLLAADVGLENALRIAADTSESSSEQATATALAAALRDGDSFAEALQKRGRPFDELYVRLVAAGEASGQLVAVFARLADHLEERAALRDSMRAALTYPAILLVVTLLSLVVLVSFVVPQFAELFTSSGGELPLASQIVFASAEWLRDWNWLLLLLLGLAVFGLPRLLRKPALRARFDRLSLRLPLLGGLLIRGQYSSFAHTLATLLRAGIPLSQALALVRSVLGNAVLRDEVEAAQVALREGRSLSDAMAAGRHTPKLVSNLLRVGEESGRLPDTLAQLGQIYDRELRSAVQRALALLEPALLIVLGLLIGGIIMSILLAILSVNELAF